MKINAANQGSLFARDLPLSKVSLSKGHGPSFLRWAGSKRKSLSLLCRAYTDPKLQYVDPPYFTSTERTFVEYGKKSFGSADLQDLIDALDFAGKKGARIALTYSEAMPISDIPKGWSKYKFEVTRNVGGFSGTRRKHAEVLYTNVQLKDIQ